MPRTHKRLSGSPKSAASHGPGDRSSRERVAEVFQRLEALRQELEAAKSKDETRLKDLIDEGRRF